MTEYTSYLMYGAQHRPNKHTRFFFKTFWGFEDNDGRELNLVPCSPEHRPLSSDPKFTDVIPDRGFRD